MPRSTPSCSTSAACRLEWRSSRWVTGALSLLAVLAPLSVLASDMPRPLAWPLAGLAAGWGLLAARRERRRPPRVLLLSPAPGQATLDGVPLAEATLAWRGPLAFLRWRDAAGRRGRLAWWPDTLPPAQRRVLKLWSPDRAGMAP